VPGEVSTRRQAQAQELLRHHLEQLAGTHDASAAVTELE
jgi:hypothetical protein